MEIPSVYIDVHHRYTPELRDRIAEKVRAAMGLAGGPSYRLLTPEHLRHLATIASLQAPILSLYLQLGPERRVGRAWHTAFTSLRVSASHRMVNRRESEAMKEEFDRIESALTAELPVLGRSVVFFVCRPLGLRQQIAVSVPLPDFVRVGSRPYIRPLVRTRDEHDRFVLAILSRAESRYFASQIGQVEEVFRVTSDRESAVLADRPARDRRDEIATEATKIEARILSHVAEMVIEQFGARFLLLSGPSDLRPLVVSELPKQLQTRLGGEFTAEIWARITEVCAAAEPAQRQVEEREEVATLQRIHDVGPRGAVWGEGPTLAALHEGRVMVLAVDDMFCKTGSRCRACRSLWDFVPASCPLCGSAGIEPVGDVVEMALEQALEQRAALEIVRSPAARRIMNGRGAMAALLRW